MNKEVNNPDNPYYEGILKNFVVLGFYQEPVNTRKLNPIDPAQLVAVAKYYETKEEAKAYLNRLRVVYRSRFLFGEIRALKFGINAAFWEKV